VREVIGWGRLPWRGTDAAADDDIVIGEVIAEHDLGDVLDRPVTSLSGGERARVHLARVLAQRAPVLLLDEADAALDLAGQAHLDAAVRRRRDAGDAIVIVGHDLGRLAALADTATLLSRGRVVGQGPAASTLTAEALTQAYGVPVETSSVDGRRVFWSAG
jgi:iron complex transport system ATP-binding protein